MYSLTVNSDSYEFVLYLKEQAKQMKPPYYVFESEDRAAKTIARFMLYYLRENEMKELFKTENMDFSKKDDFALYIPSDEIAEVLSDIQHKLTQFLHQNHEIHFEGFVHFRLRQEKRAISSLLKEALQDFKRYQHSGANLASLEEILHEQSSKVQELYMIVESKNKVILRSNDKIYLVDTLENEDAVLSHLIVLAPKIVRIFETNGTLSKETVVILRHLFKERVSFTHEPFIEHHYSKE